jgi:hypothetical protein
MGQLVRAAIEFSVSQMLVFIDYGNCLGRIRSLSLKNLDNSLFFWHYAPFFIKRLNGLSFFSR